ncbi:MAG: hypothetical protein ACE363_04730 [Alphaproteobacteria bacterium]
MSMLKVPPIHDIARIVRADGSTRLDDLVKYYELGPGKFNYNPSRAAGRKLVAGTVPYSVAVAGCYKTGSPAGWHQNADVVRLIWKWAEHKDCMAFRIAPSPLKLRPGLAVQVRPDFYYVESGVARIVWIQPRLRFNPSKDQINIIASAISHAFLNDDFSEAEIEILDFSAPSESNERRLISYSMSDLTISEPRLIAVLQSFVEVFDALVASGYERPTREKRPQAPDPRQPGLFD